MASEDSTGRGRPRGSRHYRGDSFVPMLLHFAAERALDGTLNERNVAGDMGVSRRTVQRYLAQEHLHWADIIEDLATKMRQ